MNKKNEFQWNGTKQKVWMNRGGYACIAVNQNGKERAFLLHKIVWEQANGPVPPGHDIHHKDMNKANWSVDNLTVVDRKTHREIHRAARSTDKNNKPGMNEAAKVNPKPPRKTPRKAERRPRQQAAC